MDVVINLLKTNFAVLITGLFAVLFFIDKVWDIISTYKKKLRIKTGKEQDQESIDKRIKVLEEHDNWQYTELLKMSKGIESISDRLIEKEINDWRYEILDMASAISTGRSYSKEQYDHVIAIHAKYEELLKELGRTNRQVDASMEVILETYKEKLKNGF